MTITQSGKTIQVRNLRQIFLDALQFEENTVIGYMVADPKDPRRTVCLCPKHPVTLEDGDAVITAKDKQEPFLADLGILCDECGAFIIKPTLTAAEAR